MGQYMHFKSDFYKICEKKGNDIAITYYKVDGRTEECSFLELKQRVANLMDAYESLGVMRGDRVAVLIPLCPNAYIDILALACMGCTSVVLDINMNTEELKRVLDNADVSLCITTSKIFTEKFNNIDLPVVDCFDNCDWLNNKEIAHAIDPDYEAIAILYSSGTTSRAKGVVIGYEQEMKAMDRLLEVVGTPNIRYLMLFPNSHVSGFTDFLVLLLRGGQLATMEEASATQIVRGFQLYRPNTFGMVPKVWETFKNKIEDGIREKGDKQSKQIFKLIETCGRIRTKTGVNLGRKLFKSINEQVFGGNLVQVHSGGGKSNPEVMRFFYNLGYDTYDFYASTEANIPILVTDGKKYMKSVGNVKSNPNVTIRIWNPDERGVGEIQVRSNTLMRGYFRDEKATSEAFEGEFFKTGDYGIIKNDELYIKGRLKDSIFLHNGEKVSPDDIECLMNSYIDQPIEYAIFGVKEESGYEHICLCAQAKAGSLDEYFYEINKKLPINYRFKEIVYLDELPKTSVGKVKRYKLREMYKQGRFSVDKLEDKNEERKDYNKEKKSIRDIVSNLIGIKDVGAEDMLIRDLAMDSLQIFELCVEIDSTYGVNISPMLNEDITVSKIEKMVEVGTDNSEDYKAYPAERKEKDWKHFDKFHRWTLRNYDFSCEGIEYLDESENYIFAPNHESHFDGMWVMCCLPETIRKRICSMAADYLFENNIYKRGRVIMGAIPVHRTGNSSGAMKRIYELLKSQKNSLIIHPEGTRTRTGEMGNFKDGAAELAIKTGIKIVPVAICGSYEVFPHNRKIPKIGKKSDGSRYSIKILFGEPRNPSNYKNAKELTVDLKEAVSAMKVAKTLKNFGGGGSKTLKIISDFIGKEVSENDYLYNDLGMDSLSLFSLFVELEKECGITIPTQIESIKTVGDIIDLTIHNKNEKGDPESIDYSQFPAIRTTKYERKLIALLNRMGRLYDINVENENTLPANTNCIISSNHCSYSDPLFILYALGKEYIKNTRFATLAAIHTWREDADFFNMLGGIPVVREGNTLPAIKCVRKCLSSGYDVIVFPEGARSRDGSMLPLKKGAARMAIDSKVPIVPMYIDGTFQIFPRHKKHAKLYDLKNRRKFRVNIRFGNPIYPDGFDAETLTEEVRKRLENMANEYRI